MIAATQERETAIELDRGPHAGERTRMCAVSREVRPVSELIRFVVGPDGTAVPDVKNKLPGRGLWVTATREALESAIKRKVFARGFKRDVGLPADLAERGSTGRAAGVQFTSSHASFRCARSKSMPAVLDQPVMDQTMRLDCRVNDADITLRVGSSPGNTRARRRVRTMPGPIRLARTRVSPSSAA